MESELWPIYSEVLEIGCFVLLFVVRVDYESKILLENNIALSTVLRLLWEELFLEQLAIVVCHPKWGVATIR